MLFCDVMYMIMLDVPGFVWSQTDIHSYLTALCTESRGLYVHLLLASFVLFFIPYLYFLFDYMYLVYDLHDK